MEDVSAAPLVHRIGIIGAGPTAASSAHALLRLSLSQSLISVPSPDGAPTHSLTDLIRTHAPVGASSLRAGTMEELSGVRVVVMAMEPLDDFTDTLARIASVTRTLDDVAPEAVIIVAGEPIDEGTCAVIRATSRDASRVFGLGTCAETRELRCRVSDHYDVDPSAVYALVIGHHGGGAVPVWSHVLIGAHPIIRGQVAGKSFDREAMWDAFTRGCERAAKPVGDCSERNTFEQCLSECVRSVVRDERRVLPVSARVDGPFDVRDVCLALPTIIGRDGCHGRVLPDLADDEIRAFQNAASMLGPAASVA